MVAVFGPSQLHKEGLNIVHRGQHPGLPTGIEKERKKKKKRERERTGGGNDGKHLVCIFRI